MAYFLIPIITILTAIGGSRFASEARGEWYTNIKKPKWTPPGRVIGIIWTVIFILTCASALIVWSGSPANPILVWLALIFLLNAALNVKWSWLFFGRHMLFAAFLDAVALDVLTWALVILIWPISQTAALLLLPYALWVIVAIYLSYSIYRLNPARTIS